MTNNERRPDYFERLMGIAKQSRVEVKFLSPTRFPKTDWDGLYLITRAFGPGIAIRRDLEPELRDWVLAHELGHHFGQLNGTLFSPFRAHSHRVDSLSRMRWDRAGRLDRDEESANEWAIKTLVTDLAWDEAERPNPIDLRRIVARLHLPFPAAVAWERCLRRDVHSGPVSVPLSSNALELLERPITGHGGHQSFFSRLRPRRGRLSITYADFSYARERAAVVQGGWLIRYQTILNAIEPLIETFGTSRALFNLRHAVR